MSKKLEDYERLNEPHFCQWCNAIYPMEKVDNFIWVCRVHMISYELYINECKYTKEASPFMFEIKDWKEERDNEK